MHGFSLRALFLCFFSCIVCADQSIKAIVFCVCVFFYLLLRFFFFSSTSRGAKGRQATRADRPHCTRKKVLRISDILLTYICYGGKKIVPRYATSTVVFFCFLLFASNAAAPCSCFTPPPCKDFYEARVLLLAVNTVHGSR